jgi:hypothetical protein
MGNGVYAEYAIHGMEHFRQSCRTVYRRSSLISRSPSLADRISLDFALEAKCYAPENGVGVKELSRLISRLRHRQFGILVTTSFLGTSGVSGIAQ